MRISVARVRGIENRGWIMWKRMVSAIAIAGAVVVMLAVVAALMAGQGNRLEWWDYRMALSILRVSVWTGVVGAVVALLCAIVLRRAKTAWTWALAGTVMAGALYAVPWWHQQQRPPGPPGQGMHDITTNPDDPPKFVAILPLRKNASNPPEYTAEKARRQKAAYPEFAPLVLVQAPAQVFERALDLVKSSGWEVAAAEAGEGRIEATATSFFMGFKDDVVIRIVANPKGTQLDIRSESRVGGGDFGANARRVRGFIVKLSGNS